MDNENVIVTDIRGSLYLYQARIIGCMAILWFAACVLSLFNGDIPATESTTSAIFKLIFETKGGLFLLIVVYILTTLRMIGGLGRSMGEYEGVFGTLVLFLVSTVMICICALSHNGMLYHWLG